MYKLFNFVLGFVLGALVGVALAVLLSPGSGDEIRQQIQLRADQVVQEGKRAAAERKAELESQLEALKKGKTSS
jgi:gas vesicle protein